ncbi:response regulator receiver modulated diguanylate phosphodiesterase [Catenovulum agarivorans DS-2]|uniref:Response regulator receiver modulated diguanylate phosphodiesterase n=1 Tax=Catenovulum agarivorans DS-2 TaxID=1328313 RepID=W7Q9I7_9ALTE|nr:EAL domain-containing response regulator [Catenovulum agarivorans]EWH08616.1 response regulator receiver modulated diguanylate phosphodiesterase [Catenovulum agarivorans DS-2]
MSKLQWNAVILDDSPSITALMIQVLKSAGIAQVNAFSDANQALNYVENNLVDIIFSDLNLPNIDGVEFIRLLQSKNFKGRLVIVSSMSVKTIKSVEQLARACKLDLVGSIAKPITEHAVVSMIKKAAQQKQPTHRANVEKLKIYELIRALDQHQFDLHYQPLICNKTKKLVGIEALARLNHPTKGLVFPDSFIMELEHNSLIKDLTYKQLDQVLKQISSLRDDGISLSVSLNISATLLVEKHLPDMIFELLNCYQLPPTNLVLEITESSVIEQQADMLEVLARLSMRGVKLSIDDFGTGYSSVERLIDLPFSEMKIDKTFVQQATTDESARATLESMTSMAKRLNMSIVLEGIESIEHWNMACYLNADILQGYYIAKPMPAAQLIEWIKKWQKAIA